MKWSESCSVVSDSLQPHGLYSPWNSPAQNTGVGSLSLLQGIFPTQGSNPGLLHWRRILYQLSHKGSPRILEWVAYPSPVDLPDPGIKPGSPALQADSLPTELSGKPIDYYNSLKESENQADLIPRCKMENRLTMRQMCMASQKKKKLSQCTYCSWLLKGLCYSYIYFSQKETKLKIFQRLYSTSESQFSFPGLLSLNRIFL